MAHALARGVEPGPVPLAEDIAGSTPVQLERGDVPWLCPAWLVRVGAMQADLIPPSPLEGEEPFHELFAAAGIDSCHGAARTFYSRFDDMIHLSDWRESDRHDFLRDWIHELLHATGHTSRLARDLPDAFGHNRSGGEDLIAEIGSSIVCASLGIEARLRHPDSIELWVALLRNGDRAFRSGGRRGP